MPKNLFISIWPVNSVETTCSLSIANKLATLDAAVDDASQFLAAAAARVGITKPIMVFAAPEYYFLKGTHRGDTGGAVWEPYDNDEKNEIYTGIKAISSNYKKVLIFPGTVFWRKRRAQPTGRNNARIYDGLNMAPVLYGGKVLLDYQKKFDDGACASTTDVIFQAGAGEQTFKFEGLQVGLEVCGDFEDSNLATSAPRPLDLEMYISATNPHGFTDLMIGRIPVRDGGYFVHCDATGDATKNGTWLINRRKGWHGIPSDITSSPDAAIFDPFTGKAVSIGHKLKGPYALYNVAGMDLSLSKVLKVTLDLAQKDVNLPILLAPPKPLPAPMGGKYGLAITWMEPAKPIDEGGFQMKVTAKVFAKDYDLTQRVSSALVQFSATNAVVSPVNCPTDSKGEAKTTITSTGDGPVVVTARWQGASTTGTVELLGVGAGNVSKMGKLMGNPKPDELPSWHVVL